jgi:hypothetical protein
MKNKGGRILLFLLRIAEAKNMFDSIRLFVLCFAAFGEIPEPVCAGSDPVHY